MSCINWKKTSIHNVARIFWKEIDISGNRMGFDTEDIIPKFEDNNYCNSNYLAPFEQQNFDKDVGDIVRISSKGNIEAQIDLLTVIA